MTRVRKALIAALALLTLASAAKAELYPKLFVVDSVSYFADEIGLVDANGHLWAYAGIEDWYPGDYAVAIMDDNGTPEIFDDAIETLHYAGCQDFYE